MPTQFTDHVSLPAQSKTKLVNRYSEYNRVVRSTVGESGEHNDPATEDLLTEVLRGTKLDIWFLERHANVGVLTDAA
ncbi:MAG: hypothetical protein OEN21_05155 [Myxococcales bacterium]|nr:hypothetical protein [Myxococcales bacterium]